MNVPILAWKALPQSQWDSLVLGNGASVALHQGFNYSTLHAVATAAGKLPTTIPIFAQLGTTDFEYVLLACWHASIVNAAIGAPSPAISSAYSEVRDALIHAVHQTHCNPARIANDLQRIGAFASTFNTVVTFNYDLTIYWAMLAHNATHGPVFKDAFVTGGHFEPDWEFLRKPHGGVSRTTMVFYQHGSLALARDLHGVESKLIATPHSTSATSALLSTITTRWTHGTHAPVFVSEGTTTEKMRSIERSVYLSAVYHSVLSDLGDAVAVYGLSFAPNDQHFVDALKKKPPGVLAVSVFGGLPSADQQAFCHHVSSVVRKHLPGAQLHFFDSLSPGCWNN